MINNISLNNFKCFEDESIELSNLNILAGINGMGKSTILQALLLLRQNYLLGLLDEKGISLNGDSIQIGNTIDVLFQFAEKRIIGFELESDDYGKANWQWNVPKENDFLEIHEKNNNSSIYKEALFNNSFHYLCAERLGPRSFYETSNYNVLNKGFIGTKGEYCVNYLEKFERENIPIKQLKHQSTQGYALRDQVNAWLGEIRPGTRINISSSSNMSLVGLNYQIIAGNDLGNNFRPTNVGFGLSYILPILVAILTAKPGTLIVIENPEAHLHPAGQSKLGHLFAIAAKNGIQLLIETHSDHIINGIRVMVKKEEIIPEMVRIHFFTGDIIEGQYKNYIISPEIDKDGRIDTWPPGFLDEWNNNLTHLL